MVSKLRLARAEIPAAVSSTEDHWKNWGLSQRIKNSSVVNELAVIMSSHNGDIKATWDVRDPFISQSLIIYDGKSLWKLIDPKFTLTSSCGRVDHFTFDNVTELTKGATRQETRARSVKNTSNCRCMFKQCRQSCVFNRYHRVCLSTWCSKSSYGATRDGQEQRRERPQEFCMIKFILSHQVWFSDQNRISSISHPCFVTKCTSQCHHN